MAEVERKIYFYKVEMADSGQWSRADVLRALEGLRGEDQVMSLGGDTYTWVIVDHVPRTRESGRLRFFRDRRSNLPGFADNFHPAELPIPAEAGLIEPTHLVVSRQSISSSRSSFGTWIWRNPHSAARCSTTRRPTSTSSRPCARFARPTFLTRLSSSSGPGHVRRLAANVFIDHRGKLEAVIAVVLVLAFLFATDAKDFTATLDTTRRGALYGSLAGTAGALLGFVLTALAILVALPSSERLEALRSHPKWPRVPSEPIKRIDDPGP
jgi:hypothetical protein